MLQTDQPFQGRLERYLAKKCVNTKKYHRVTSTTGSIAMAFARRTTITEKAVQIFLWVWEF